MNIRFHILAFLVGEPRFKLTDTGFTYDYFFGSWHKQINRNLTAKPYRNILNCLACNDKLAVGTEKQLWVQLRRYILQRCIEVIHLLVIGYYFHHLVFGIKVYNFVYLKRNKLILVRDQKSGLITFIGLPEACYKVC